MARDINIKLELFDPKDAEREERYEKRKAELLNVIIKNFTDKLNDAFQVYQSIPEESRAEVRKLPAVNDFVKELTVHLPKVRKRRGVTDEQILAFLLPDGKSVQHVQYQFRLSYRTALNRLKALKKAKKAGGIKQHGGAILWKNIVAPPFHGGLGASG